MVMAGKPSDSENATVEQRFESPEKGESLKKKIPGALKRKSPGESEATAGKKRRYEQKPEWANRRGERREVMTQAKGMWEKLRPKATSKEKSSKLVDDLINLLSGRIVEFVFRHDGSRIVQWMLAEGNKTQKRTVLDELMKACDTEEGDTGGSFFARLACDRYGHHLAFKILRAADKENKAILFEKHLKGHASVLIRNANGADLLDVAYQTVLNSRAKSELVIELLYGHEQKLLQMVKRKLFGVAEARRGGDGRCIFADSLDLLDESFRDVVVESAGVTLGRLIEKGSLVRFEIVHVAVKEYLQVLMESYGKEKSVELAVTLAPLLVDFAHTKAGLFVAVNCIKILDAKHRKKVVRGLKTHVRRLLEDEYGNRLILALFEWVDDTRLVGKLVTTEVYSGSKLTAELNEVQEEKKGKSRGGKSKAEKKGKIVGRGSKGTNEEMDLEYMRKMCMHKWARMPLLSLFVGRDTRYFNPDLHRVVWKDVKTEKFGQTSKKDSEVRRKELREMFDGGVSKVMQSSILELTQCLWSAPLVLGALQIVETRQAVMSGLKKCVGDEEKLGKLVGSVCGRKTLGTIFKIGGKETACGVVDACGLEVVERLAGKKECMPIAEHLAKSSEREEVRRIVEQDG